METLKTDGLAYALEVAINYSGMLHMLSTLKLILYGIGIFRAWRQSNPATIFTLVQDPFQPPLGTC